MLVARTPSHGLRARGLELPEIVYAICVSPRSGSTLLCRLLERSGAMGRPGEFFQDKVLVQFAGRNELAGSDGRVAITHVVERLIAEFTSPNGVFGMKLMPGHLQPLLRFESLHELLRRCRYIWLERDDVVGQAVSWHIAESTGQWRSAGGDNADGARPVVAYEHDEIARWLKVVNAANDRWREFFAVNDVEFLPVRYEELLADTNATCRRICDFCGIATQFEFALGKSPLRRQRTKLNDEFKQRFARGSWLALRCGGVGEQVEIKQRQIKVYGLSADGSAPRKDRLELPEHVYAICASPKSGSSLLCSLLGLPRVMGFPREYFDMVARLASRHGLLDSSGRASMDKYLKWLVAEFTTANGVFGAEIMGSTMRGLMAFASVHDLLRKCRFVWLRRDDAVAQAVSRYIAETRKWRHADGPAGTAVSYDRAKIAVCLKYINDQNRIWREFFAVNRLDFMTVSYEELIEDSNATCHRICGYCGVDTDFEFMLEKSHLKKQRTELSDEFRERFIRESPWHIGREGSHDEPCEIEMRGLVLCEG